MWLTFPARCDVIITEVNLLLDIVFYKRSDILKKLSVYWRIFLVIVAAVVVMAVIGFFPKLCDWYTDHIYGHLCDGISRVTSHIPFALGEILMYIGALGLVLCVIFPFLLIFFRKKTGYHKFCITYLKSFLMVFACVVFVYLPTWFIPFCGTVLGEGDVNKRTEFSNEEFDILFRYVVKGANAAADEIEIYDDGTVQFPSEKEIQQLSAEAMLSLKEEFPRLAGYYPQVKSALCSNILHYMGIGGYNYPYTMEPTHNKYCSPMYQMVLDAHELAHHKGYYKENEANFLSQLALTQCDNPYLRLAGYYEMYCYLIDKYYSLDHSLFGDEPQLSERARKIMAYSDLILEKQYESDANPIDNMPAVQEVISTISENGWKIQGEILQENSYRGCVLLLLQYYDGKLY